MNRRTFYTPLFIGSLWLCAVTAYALPITTSYVDNYQGAAPNGYTDVIAASNQTNWFDITGALVTLTDTQLQIDIVTDFMTTGLGSYTNLTKSINNQRPGIGAGDLFLSIGGWDPTGTEANRYSTDSLKQSGTTQWTHALTLDNRWSSTGGTATLVELPTSTNNGYQSNDYSYILTAEDFMSSGIYRHNQAVAVKPNSATPVNTVTATWAPVTTVINGNSKNALRFSVDLMGTDLLGETLGVHWAMTCANDVIEFSLPLASMTIPENRSSTVPEPNSLLLLMSGLVLLWWHLKNQPGSMTAISIQPKKSFNTASISFRSYALRMLTG
ncbi:PEP-CTERM sorting domain-containing protein [Thiospirillum jenense]|uniref:PEP-CTERM sorting domain-containing protein n=1 Tax=Thiospirillum jenense TaxID=1653858 RepID=A0A839HHB6_9GAMM|nr:PEP-CTERM sorting domain-containing protein [Thiospirillum jenense]MBB1126239.1 PEP-CTERM sorting domain-containing protein [Thiospirillum jenense]